METERVSNAQFGSDDPPEPDAPALECYQSPEGNLRVEEADGPVGAWIELEIETGGRR